MESLLYQKYIFTLKFAEKISFTVDPVFLIRSVLGYNLRKICCLSRNSVCSECLYNKDCMYSWLFESIISKDNLIVENRDRTSHPYILFSNKKVSLDTPCDSFTFDFILLGRSIKYLPYIYAALVRAGEAGLDKNRIQFSVESVTVDGSDIIQDSQISPDVPGISWSFTENSPLSGEILVQLLTPLRFKASGKYTIDFSAQDFFLCLARRYAVLCQLYGEYTEEKYFFPQGNITLENRNLSWIDIKHYSARQKEQMKLGGVSGSFTLKGRFSEKELALLEFAKIFGAGKNTNFGLGRLDYWIRTE